MNFYQKSVAEVCKEVQTTLDDGLSEQEAHKRYTVYGPNVLIQKITTEPFIIIFFKQFRSSLIYILLLSAALILFSGEPLDALIISGILLFNAILGALQERNAQKILKELEHYSKPTCVVIRDGKEKIIATDTVVIGDLILLQAGDKIPADARLVQAYNLQIDESMLTGETEGINKFTEVITYKAPISEQKNMVFKGTYILQGDGLGIVIATGNQTQIGLLKKITEEEIKQDFPLKKKLDQLSRWIVILIFFLCIFLLIVGLFTNKSLTELIVFLTALFICVIPEGLPLVFTVSLVTGAQRMAKKHVLIKKLQAVEGLGVADVIITDKTGTLTRNEMIATDLFVDTFYKVTGEGYFSEGKITDEHSNPVQINDGLRDLAKACKLLSDAIIDYDQDMKLFRIKGQPMDAALEIVSEKIAHFPKLAVEYKKFYELPFDIKSRIKANFYYYNNAVVAFMVGPPDQILNACKNKQPTFDNSLKQFFAKGLRTVALAYKKIPINEFNKQKKDYKEFYMSWINNGFNCLGMVGIQDTIRPEVDRVIKETRDAGLQIIMATGDYLDTALNVAKKVSLFNPGDKAITGSELDELSEKELIHQLNSLTVFSRVTPEQKLAIVKLYQKNNKIVAMTGDGINDAPALIAADLGIAMGNIGTEVAKQAADLILLDDSFLSIIDAIKEGRHIFFTLRKVTLYFFTTNMAEILLVTFTFISNLPFPLFPAQILWLNLVTDGFLNVSLAWEPEEKNLLQARLTKQDRLLNTQDFLKILYMSLPMAIGSFIIFSLYLYDLKLARTMAFSTMALFQWFNIWNCRSEKESIVTIGFFSNKWLLLACVVVFALQIIIIYTPLTNYIFKTVSLNFNQWIITFFLASSILFFEELRKKITRAFIK